MTIVFLWEEWQRTPEGWNLVVTRFKNYPNQKSELYQSDIDDVVALMGRASNSSWVSFRAFVERREPIERDT